MAGRPPKSKMSRLARLGTLTSRVSGSYLGQRITGAFQGEEQRAESLRQVHLKNAERVVSTMGALKGAAMKVGQQLAQVTDGMDLPPEVANILGQLNDRAEPVPFDTIRRSVEAELEGDLGALFSEFDEEPLGTASLAQAHAARLPSGERVVVKVLHHGIEQSVDSDLAALKGMLVTGRVLRRDKSEIDAVFAEIRDRLAEELDYYQEAANLEHFRRVLGPMEGIEVPGTFPKYSTGRVLTMERLTGGPLDQFVERASPETMQLVGDRLVRVFYEMSFRHRTLHADPHAGNYLFKPDGTIGLIDFGCVKRFDPYWMGRYAGMAIAILDQDRDVFLNKARDLEILKTESDDAKDVLWDLSALVCKPLMVPQYRCGTDEDDVTQQVQRLGPRLLRHKGVQSPRELVFLHRALGGTYAMLRKVKHEAGYRSLARNYFEHAVAVSEGRVVDGAAVEGAVHR